MQLRTDIETFGVVGCGVVGSGWATRALSRSLDVVAWDPAPQAEDRMRAVIDGAWHAVRKLGTYPGADPGRVRFVDSIDELGATADFIQESAPEDPALKKSLLADIDGATPPDVLIATSTSGLLLSDLAADCAHPERLVVGHPFNPVYLLPLCEVVGGTATAPEAVTAAIKVYDFLDMYPLEVRHEIDGHLADRLQEALWREILHIINEGHATTGELDDSIIYGPGLRWAAMGTNLIYHLAGGPRGMRHMLEQFGPTLKLPWSKLEAPDLTDDLIDALVTGTGDQAAGRPIDELERLRDDYLIAVMKALRAVDIGAGRIFASREARRYDHGAVRWRDGDAIDAPLTLYRCQVEPEWVDYNDHMTEAAFLTAFGWASDALFRYIGNDEGYRAAENSFYTVESHINYRREALLDDPLRFTTQILGLDDKRLHFYHEMYNTHTDELLCTTEQMLVHVDTVAARSAPIMPGPKRALETIWEVHKNMPRPENVGRVMEVPE
jgi:carnitine 3-dehydrogenase